MKEKTVSAFLFLLFLTGHVPVQGQPPTDEKIQFYAMWNDQYLYLAAKVDDPNIVGTHGQLMGDLWNDDDLEIFIETDYARSPSLTDKCYRFAASARGGAGVSFYQGMLGQWSPDPRIGGLRLEVAVQGTLNKPDDRDEGYLIEMGIPWEMLGGQPPRDRYQAGFNVVKYMRGERDAFYSYSPLVQSEEHLNQPHTWSQMIFKKTARIRPREQGSVSCIWTDEIPIIDGRLSIGEWKPTSYNALPLGSDLIHPVGPPQEAPIRPLPPTRPEQPPIGPEQPPTGPEQPPTGPEQPPTGPEQPPIPLRGPYSGENLVLSSYYYWYQGDERYPSLPSGQIRYPDGRSQLSLKPMLGTGPWFSTLRVGWHYDQLSELRRADIDVVLPIYYADAESRRNWSLPGLMSMMMALRELDRWQKEYPLVGMFFATESLQREVGEPLDLTSPAHRALFYSAIREFFWHVPPPYRAVVTDGPRRACLVALSSPEPFARVEDSLFEECNALFQRDFGCELIWLASPAWQKLGLQRIDGYANLIADLQPHRNEAGRLTLASLGPGYDNTAMEGAPPQIRSRMASQTIKEDLEKVLNKPVNWLVLTDWNNYQTGSNLAPSREFGLRFVDLGALCALHFNGALERTAKFVRDTTPARMLPGGTYQVELRLTNAGFTHWTAEQNVNVSYRWYKEGHLIEEEGARTGPLTVRQSQSKTLWATVKAAKKDGTPLEEGQYELRWDLVAQDIDWFSLRGDPYFSVPVEITTLPSYAGRILATDVSLRLETGQTYPVRVRLRNEGILPWQGLQIGYEWEQRSDPRAGEIATEPVILAPPDPPEPIAQIQPGEIFEFNARVHVAQADGTPLEPTLAPGEAAAANGARRLFLRWYLVGPEGQRLPDTSVPPYHELVEVIPHDYGVAFIGGQVPTTMEAGQTVDAQPTIQNSAFATWQPGEMALSYHWYYWDGTEAEWEGLRTPLPQPVASGQKLSVPMKIQAPPYPGQYMLVLDMVGPEGVWTSHTPSTYSRDLAPISVLVTGDRLVPVDLRKVYNVDGISFDLNRTDGSFDGQGHTFPAENMPPDVIPPRMPISEERLYPCGYWGPREGEGRESSRRIAFQYPPQLDGEKNVVACDGQKVTLPGDRYLRLHLLGAGTARDATDTFKLLYKPERSVELTMSFWENLPLHGEHIALMTYHRHRSEGDEVDRKCYLFHYVIDLDPTQPLKGLLLPKNPYLRIVAMTLEKPGPEGN